MNLFSFLRFFRTPPDEPVNGVNRSSESQERPRGFFLDKEWPVRPDNRAGQPPEPARRPRPRTENPKIFSFSRFADEQEGEDSRLSESRERSGGFTGGHERIARTTYPVERNPVRSGRFVPAASDRQGRSSGSDAGRTSNTRALLEDLKNLDPGILIVFITSNDGRLAEHTVTTFAEKVRIGASSAISLAVARKESKDLQLGDARELQIRSDSGSILLLSLGARGVLTVVANQNADTDRIVRESYQLAEHLMSSR